MTLLWGVLAAAALFGLFAFAEGGVRPCSREKGCGDCRGCGGGWWKEKSDG